MIILFTVLLQIQLFTNNVSANSLVMENTLYCSISDSKDLREPFTAVDNEEIDIKVNGTRYTYSFKLSDNMGDDYNEENNKHYRGIRLEVCSHNSTVSSEECDGEGFNEYVKENNGKVVIEESKRIRVDTEGKTKYFDIVKKTVYLKPLMFNYIGDRTSVYLPHYSVNLSNIANNIGTHPMLPEGMAKTFLKKIANENAFIKIFDFPNPDSVKPLELIKKRHKFLKNRHDVDVNTFGVSPVSEIFEIADRSIYCSILNGQSLPEKAKILDVTSSRVEAVSEMYGESFEGHKPLEFGVYTLNDERYVYIYSDKFIVHSFEN